MKKVVTFVLTLFTGSLCALSCGDASTTTEKLTPRQIREALPTAANFQGWQKVWDKDTWIVALRLDEPAVRQKNTFKSLVARSLVEQFSAQLSGSDLLSLSHFFAQQLEVEVIEVKDFANPISPALPVENMFGFGRVKIKDSQSTFATLLGAAGVALPEGGIERDRALIQAQFDGLQRVSGVAWAEPNLFAESNSLPVFNARSDHSSDAAVGPNLAADFAQPAEILDANENISQILTSIKWDAANKYAAEKGLEQHEVVVAVIDTGVDWKVPELDGHIFNNDNVGSAGYANDLHGIDATVEKGSIDSGANPIPGSADVGGPGVACGEARPGAADSCGHGTHVAGIIAAKQGASSDLHMMGVCPACKIMSMRVAPRCLRTKAAPKGPCVPVVNPPNDAKGEYEDDGSIPDIAQVRALAYALNLTKPGNKKALYVNVINLSLGKYYYNRAMASLVRRLRQNEIIIVAAAGNNNTETPMFPAGYGGVLAVCAVETARSGAENEAAERPEQKHYAKASFSNFGDWVDVCSPGVQIPSTIPGYMKSEDFVDYDRHNVKSGTSQAGPIVAGAAAFLRSVNPGMSADDVIDRIKRYANPDLIYNNARLPFNANYGGTLQNVPFYSLGTGYLDLANALTKEKESYAYLDETSGRTKQNIGVSNGGCLVSSVGARYNGAVWNMFTTMPFLLAQFWLVLKFFGTLRLSTRKKTSKKV